MDSQSSFPGLTTDRLQLRKLVLEDAQDILLLRSDEQVNEYLDRPTDITYDKAIEFIKKVETAIKKDSFYWAISFKNDNKLIGTICLWNINPEEASIEIGYELLPDHQHKGLMQEALAVVIAYAFDKLKYQTIKACTHKANQSSIILLERNNFVLQPNPIEDISPEILYSLQNNHKKA